jgi:hypothetical protein
MREENEFTRFDGRRADYRRDYVTDPYNFESADLSFWEDFRAQNKLWWI